MTHIKRMNLKFLTNRQVLLWAIEVVIAIVLALLINAFVSGVIVKRNSGYCGIVLWVAVCLIGLCLYNLRTVAIKKMEIIFAVVALVLGVFYISVSPDTVGVSWDDEIHYGRTVTLVSFLSGGTYYYADEDQITSYQTTIASYTDEQKSGFSRENRRSMSERMNGEYEQKTKGNNPQRYVSFFSIAYIPSAIGIIMGRIFKLSWVSCFNLGRLFNLFSYVTVITLAIRRTKTGKLLCTLIGLIPTSIFMAASYSYDPWVISWTILGFVEFFNLVTDNEIKIKKKQWIKMLIIFTIGFLPKMVYVVALFPLLFVQSDRFESKKDAYVLKVLVIVVAIILAVTYIGPEMIRGALAVGDPRGGSNVSTSGQIHFMLANPRNAAIVIMNFFIQYAGLSTGNYTQLYAYLGSGYFDVLILITLCLVVVLEGDSESRLPNNIRITGIIGVIFGVLVVILSLYLSFNPVGSQTIAGVQNRYLFPLFFPLGYYLMPAVVKVKSENERLAVYSVAFFALTFIYNIYCLCIRYY